MPARSQLGFTLIEVLVAVIVFSLGMLGIAGLQVTGLRMNYSAYQRTQANLLSYDIIDRMRANVEGVKDGDYNNAIATQYANCLTVTTCSAQEMAQHDVFEWNAALADALPGGVGVVCVDSTPDDGTSAAPACDNTATGTAPDTTVIYAIKVWWDDDRSGAADQRFVTTFQPCLPDC